MSHFFHQIGTLAWSVENNGVVIGYMMLRLLSSGHSEVYSVRKTQNDEWVGAHLTKQRAHRALENMA